MIYLLLLCDAAMGIGFALRFTTLPPQIPLFYSKAFGEDQLAEVWYIFLLPLFIHLFIFLNLFIYNRFFLPNQLIKKIIDITNTFVIIACSYIFLKIIFFIS